MVAFRQRLQLLSLASAFEMESLLLQFSTSSCPTFDSTHLSRLSFSWKTRGQSRTPLNVPHELFEPGSEKPTIGTSGRGRGNCGGHSIRR